MSGIRAGTGKEAGMELTIREVRDYIKTHSETAILLEFSPPAEGRKEESWKQKQD